MAYTVKLLDEASLAPRPGDGGVLLFLRSSETGYRGRALVVAPDGRPLREGVRVSSTCPVAATQDLYLSCTSAGWEMGAIGVAPDSEFRLDEIMRGGQPIQPMNWQGDHRNVLDIISNSFGAPQRLLPPPPPEAPPAAPAESRPRSRQRVPERPPAAQRAPERPPAAQRAPERPPAAQRPPERLSPPQELPRERRPSPAREGREVRAQAPQERPPRPELDEEAQATMLTLAAAARDLKRGVPASAVVSSLVDALADHLIEDDEALFFHEDAEDGDDGGDGDGDDDGDDGDDGGDGDDGEDLDDEDDGDLYGDDEDVDEDVDEDLDGEDDEDLDGDDEDLDEDLDEGEGEGEDEGEGEEDEDAVPAPVTVLRPLQVGEIPVGLKADEVAQLMAYTDPAAEDKMRRTQERASAAIQRARMIGSMQEQERQRQQALADLAAQAEAQLPPHPDQAPKAPRARRAPEPQQAVPVVAAEVDAEPSAPEAASAEPRYLELGAEVQLPQPVSFKGQAWYTLEQVAVAAGVSVATARNRVKAANIFTMRASVQKGPGAPKILIPAEAVRLRAS